MLAENTLLKTASHFLLLLIGFDTLTYRKDYDRSPTLVGHQPAELNLDDDGDDDESEVELDSLGSFFIHLIDNDCYQEKAEASRAGDDEVIILSSGSEFVPK